MSERSRPLHHYLPAGVPADEESAQALVLALLLCQHPRGVSILELALQLSRDEYEGWVERAVRDLVCAGLARCEGCAVFAALDRPRPNTEHPSQGKPASR